MKKLLIAIALLSTVGCASQPSTYTDKSTPDQRNIEATGRAATEAARSNTSRNASVTTPVHMSSNDRYDLENGRYVVYKNGKRDHRSELKLLQKSMHNRNGRQSLGDYTSNRMSREWDHRIRRKVDAEVNRLMEKIF